MELANTALVERADDGALIVSSLTIAEGSGVEHRAVLQLIGKRTAEIERFGSIAFEMRSQDRGGHPVRVALLNERQATLLMSFQSNTDQVVTFKVALVEGFYEMAERIKNVPALTPEEIVAQALQITTAQVAELKAARAIDAPKVGYVNSFVADNDTLLFRTVASNLEVGENALRWGLAYAGWIYHDQQRRRNSKGAVVTEYLWSEYSHKKPYFRRILNHQAPLFKDNTAYTLKVTPSGASAIAAWVERMIADHGTFDAAVTSLEIRYNEKKAA